MFGQRLRLTRNRAGLSMQALAECATPSVSAQAISKYAASNMMPSSSVLAGLGKTLNVSPPIGRTLTHLEANKGD